uniref:Uncharacterized protein n=1 Tax=Marseillevirus LCMAC201 TaxID=2506605 RepID=A0A481YWE2_9VIRU|nr:MAG: hypothetical protein LCMAC201_02500 [Marseillevirus LCMAC201]
MLEEVPIELLGTDPFEFMHGIYGHQSKMTSLHTWKSSEDEDFNSYPYGDTVDKENILRIRELLETTTEQYWEEVY